MLTPLQKEILLNMAKNGYSIRYLVDPYNKEKEGYFVVHVRLVHRNPTSRREPQYPITQVTPMKKITGRTLTSLIEKGLLIQERKEWRLSEKGQKVARGIK